MKISFLALLLFSTSIFTSPLPAEASSEIATQDSGDITPVVDEWLTEVAKSKDGKRIKVRYKVDFQGKPDWIRGFEYFERGSWRRGLSGKDANGYYVTNIYRYYF